MKVRNKMETLVSIILPAYNVADYLERSIKSILSQTFSNYEVIIVNDGSTDDTLAVFKKLNLDYRFSIYTKNNEGSGMARNYGLKKAKGKYIYFMDPDDSIDSKLLEDNIDLLSKYDSEFSIFGYRELYKNNDIGKEFKVNTFKYINTMQLFQEELLNLNNQTSISAVWNKVYKKDFLIKNNLAFLNLPIGQDAYFNWNVFEKTNSIITVPGVYYNYYIEREGSATTQYNPHKYFCEKKILKKMIQVTSKWNSSYLYKNMINTFKINLILTEVRNVRKSERIDYSYIKTDSIVKELKNLSLLEINGIKNKIKLLTIKIFM